MADLIRKRLTGKEEGFTLIELLVVIVILGILMAIAVPSYMGFRDRAQQAAAQANVRAALPSAEAYYSDNNDYAFTKTASGGVAATPKAALQSYDAGLATTVHVAAIAGNATYCLSDKQGTYVARVVGPQGATGAAPMTVNKTNAEC